MEFWSQLNQKYEASSLGRIRNSTNGKILKDWETGSGYRKVQIEPNRGRYRVHRLIAECFVPKPSDEFLVVHHINGNRSDNRALNLLWCTQAMNMEFARAGNPPIAV